MVTKIAKITAECGRY